MHVPVLGRFKIFCWPAFAKSDGAAGVTDALQFFTDIHAQFGVTTPDYAKKMVGVVNSIIAFMNCPH